MKRLLIAVLGLGLLAGMAGPALSDTQTSVTGELRDSFCFLRVGASGPSHHECAMQCAKAGIPVTLVQDGTGTFFVLLPPKNKVGIPQSVIDRMEQKVTVTGYAFDKGGTHYLTVESIK